VDLPIGRNGASVLHTFARDSQGSALLALRGVVGGKNHDCDGCVNTPAGPKDAWLRLHEQLHQAGVVGISATVCKKRCAQGDDGVYRATVEPCFEQGILQGRSQRITAPGQVPGFGGPGVGLLLKYFGA
jgi:hypothetical protein